MKRISYCRTNNMKLILFGFALIYFILRMIIMVEIVIFKIPGYYENLNIPLTIILYAAIFAVIISILTCHRNFYSLYDDKTLTYYNRYLRREKSLELSEAKLAVFGSRGVNFYTSPDGETSGEAPVFFLPFFRGGIIDALDINGLFLSLKDRDDMRVIKNFTVLPGYGKPWSILKIVYGFLAVVMMVSCATPLALVIVLFQNH
ncbi:MAG: hypothetical protein ACI4LC_03015 [Emergencia sp.]